MLLPLTESVSGRSISSNFQDISSCHTSHEDPSVLLLDPHVFCSISSCASIPPNFNFGENGEKNRVFVGEGHSQKEVGDFFRSTARTSAFSQSTCRSTFIECSLTLTSHWLMFLPSRPGHDDGPSKDPGEGCVWRAKL
jgi:hypothetical protein